MKCLQRGILITLEGIDGSGKTTVVHHLKDQLQKRDIPVVLTREPGGTPLGKIMRTIVQEYKDPITSKAEFLLYSADRAQHIEQVVKPALAEHRLVISDRMADSSRAYQGFGRGLDVREINSVTDWVMNGVKPDLVLYFVLDSETAWQRIQARKQTLTRFEQEKRAFFDRVIEGFETIFKDRSDVVRIDASKNPDQVIEQALQAVMDYVAQFFINN